MTFCGFSILTEKNEDLEPLKIVLTLNSVRKIGHQCPQVSHPGIQLTTGGIALVSNLQQTTGVTLLLTCIMELGL